MREEIVTTKTNKIRGVMDWKKWLECFTCEDTKDGAFEVDEKALMLEPDLLNGAVFTGADDVPVPTPLSLVFIHEDHRTNCDLYSICQLVLGNRRFGKKNVKAKEVNNGEWVAEVDVTDDVNTTVYSSSTSRLPCMRSTHSKNYRTRRDATNAVLFEIVCLREPDYWTRHYMRGKQFMVLEDTSRTSANIEESWLLLFRLENNLLATCGRTIQEQYPLRKCKQGKLTEIVQAFDGGV